MTNLKAFEYAKWHLPKEEEILSGSDAFKNLLNLDFAHRHWKRKVLRAYGVWRWHGIINNYRMLLDLIEKSKIVVDFGGHSAQLGFGSYVVDIKSGIPPEEFYEKFRTVDLFFSSGTLEHIPEKPEEVLKLWKRTMRKGATLFLHIDSYRNKRWQHIVRKPAHEHTFYINEDKKQTEREPYVKTSKRTILNGGGILNDHYMEVFTNLEELVGKYFHIEICKNAPEWMILIVAKK